jgi:hypothetical protein
MPTTIPKIGSGTDAFRVPQYRSHEPIVDTDPCMTVNNICQDLFGEGVKTYAEEMGKKGTFQGLITGMSPNPSLVLC